tara:strand:+ start:66 stop:368 length:303 start_codon:yes stop_codon:yes gene_type:complete
MINSNESLSLSEATEYIKKSEGNEKLVKFVKDFVKLKVKEGKELRKKLEDLSLMKLKSQQITKIIEQMPDDQEDLNKIFVEVKLDEDESKKILETVKEFK